MSLCHKCEPGFTFMNLWTERFYAINLPGGVQGSRCIVCKDLVKLKQITSFLLAVTRCVILIIVREYCINLSSNNIKLSVNVESF